MKPSTLGGWIARHAGELRLAARTTLAGLITFAVGHLLELPQSYWAVLTSVIVIQASLGRTIQPPRVLGFIMAAADTARCGRPCRAAAAFTPS